MENKTKKIRVALAGNPNSGKSTVFNALTGMRQHIANYPGVTVEKKIGMVEHRGYEIEVVDLPGTYSLTAYSIEEVVARNFIIDERPDMVVDIVDASNLERNLYLFVQLMELGCPLILGLNMMDMARARKIIVDVERLSKGLGVPVVPMVARSGEGVKELLDAIVDYGSGKKEFPRPNPISYGMDVDRALKGLTELLEGRPPEGKSYAPKWLALKFLEADKDVQRLIMEDPQVFPKAQEILSGLARHTMDTVGEEPESVIADHRYGFISGVVRHAVKREAELRINFSDKLDKVLTNRLFGPVFMLLVLYSIYTFIFWASEEPIAILETGFEHLKALIQEKMEEGLLKSLLVSGIIDSVGAILGYVPLIFFLFGAISILEDSGYMARIAYMMDRIMRFFGLHGSSVIALIVSGGISGGCAVPGVLATRTMRDPKERIVTALAAPFMNCGGKLPIYAIIISAFFVEHRARLLFLITLFSWLLALLAAKLLRTTVLKGPKSPFLMELPPYRLPTLRGILIHSWERTWLYIKRAGSLILAFSILFWAGLSFPTLPQEKRKGFEERKNKEISWYLKSSTYISSEGELGQVLAAYAKVINIDEQGRLPELGERQRKIIEGVRIQAQGGTVEPDLALEIEMLKELKKRLDNITIDENLEGLKNTYLGRLGVLLEAVTRPLGFDYKLNIALISGFIAKEMVVTTLGTAYSISTSETGFQKSLEDHLKSDPHWGKALAFLVLIFVTIYVPCLPTLLTIGNELSWRWAFLSLGFSLMLAYGVSLVARLPFYLFGN